MTWLNSHDTPCASASPFLAQATHAAATATASGGHSHPPSGGLFATWLLTILCLLFLLPRAHANDSLSQPTPTRAVASLNQQGQLLISSRFYTELPNQLQSALEQGVPLNFELRYRLQSPTVAAYRNRISQMVGNKNSIRYKLSYHPLTSSYRVTVGTFSTEYTALPNALRAVGAVANWPVLEAGTLSDTPPENVAADIRLNLSISDLPRPFQINAATSTNWQLDSGWHKLNIQQPTTTP